MAEVLRYPSKLLKIETGQQLKQLSIFDDQGKINRDYSITLNKSIERILNLNANNGNYSVELPNEIDAALSEDIRKKVTKELSGGEVRVLTSVLALAQNAIMNNDLYYMEKTNQAYFEFTLSSLYQFSGLKKDKNGNYDKKQKDHVNSAIIRLHRKEFIVPVQFYEEDKKSTYKGVKIEPLLQIHEMGEWENSKTRKKTQVYKLTISGVFLNINEKKSNYFNLPADLNKNLRSINPGRPNAGIELFIKCLYQAVHCSKENCIEYSHNRLVEIMKLERHKKNKNYTRIKDTIEKAFKTAMALEIIESWEQAKTKYGGVKYVLNWKLT
ncbi:hypothetical protein [Flexithrix dorotheae]|uniref:hypothetical protein n=1 Tax=Flexithrix dorotheae TaxID=70993 RepID=UPI000377C6B7|nr:hypothetical protein [Flexithrix dorotheae]